MLTKIIGFATFLFGLIIMASATATPFGGTAQDTRIRASVILIGMIISAFGLFVFSF